MLKSKLYPDIEELLNDVEIKLLTIKKRYYYLQAYQKEIKICVGDKDVSIANDIIWQMLNDSYDMLVIDLTSLCKSMYKKKGFFNKLKSHHISKFKLPKKRAIQVTKGILNFSESNPEKIEAYTKLIEEKEKNEIIKAVQNSIDELFSSRENNKKVTTKDIDNLKENFINIVQPVIKERDSYRAHKFEKGPNHKIELLDLDEIGNIYKIIETYIDHIRLITTQSTLAYRNMNKTDLKDTAKDICDQILMGSSGRACLLLGLSKKKLVEQRLAFYKNSIIDKDNLLYSDTTSLIKN